MMKIKPLFILSISLIFVVAGLGLFYALKFRAFHRLHEIEIGMLKARNIEIMRTVQNEFNQNQAYTKDWANWDDTYSFMQTKDTDYMKANFSQEVLIDNKVLGMMFFSQDFKIFSSYGLGDQKNEFTSVCYEIQNKKKIILNALDNKKHQLILYNKNLKKHILTTIYPITPTHNLNLSNGYLISVGFIDEAFAQRISYIMDKTITIAVEKIKVKGFECVAEKSTEQFCNRYDLVSDSVAHLSVRIMDSENLNAIYFQTKIQRSFNEHIQYVFHQTLLIILIIGFCVVFLNLLLVQWIIIHPIKDLAKGFAEIEETPTLEGKRLAHKGPLEIRHMTTAANNMLDQIEMLQNKVERLSKTDELTQIYNRRYFNEQYEIEFKRALRKQYPITLIMLDIDFFKQFNDNYGHVAGDICLQKVAAVLQNCLNRATDCLARYGGEEFIIMIFNATVHDMNEVINKITTGLEQAAIEHNYSSVSSQVTCSIGGICITPSSIEDQERLLLKVDSLLYQAKEKGRNRAVTDSRLNSTNPGY